LASKPGHPQHLLRSGSALHFCGALAPRGKNLSCLSANLVLACDLVSIGIAATRNSDRHSGLSAEIHLPHRYGLWSRGVISIGILLRC
jgi:hypothetical protein